jgi:transcription elongation factor GreA
VGVAENSVGGRIAALERHILGDRQPHTSSQWLKTLRVSGLRVWWAETDAREEYEDALLGAFAEAVDAADRAALHDPDVVLPFANLRRPDGTPKGHGITGSVPPAETVPAVPPTRLVQVAPGDAEGARTERKGSGTTRPARAPAVRRPATPKPKPSRAADPLVVSADGLARLQAEHGTLVARRPGVVARIRAAKELGDLKENSDYTAAREEQSFLEGRIQAIEAQLRVAVVADAPSDRSRVAMGSRVGVEHNGDAFILQLVGPTESDAAAGRISVSSPVGRALLGAEVGQEVTIRTPGGEVRYRVTTLE